MVIHLLGLDLIVRKHHADDSYSREDTETGGPLPAGVEGIDPHIHVEPDPSAKPAGQWSVLNPERRDWPSYRLEDMHRRTR